MPQGFHWEGRNVHREIMPKIFMHGEKLREANTQAQRHTKTRRRDRIEVYELNKQEVKHPSAGSISRTQ